MVSRSVSRPLVDLARQADELATTLPSTVQAILDASSAGTEAPKVPEVKVNSRDEVADMARALEAVNKTAVELASGQAALRRNLADAFVNLGRRNQNLVTRQLEYISEIELKEADPESLEELFRLDHLATRMRRNAESLLILAGSGPARQWSAAVPAMDVARAASAEVEDYKRLRLHHFDPAQLTGGVTTDLVHILAELIENALTFSPPGSPVDVYGRFLEGGYVIVIVDSGIGMSADDLVTANRRLVGQGSDSEVPGRYLGHFVAGRLASRHDITISLQSSHSGGLVAQSKIPALLIEEPVPDLSAMAEVRSAPATPSVGTPAPTVSANPAFVAPSPPAAAVVDAVYEPAAPVPPVVDRLADHRDGPEDGGDADKVLAQWADEMAETSWGGTPEPDNYGDGDQGAGYQDDTFAPLAEDYSAASPEAEQHVAWHPSNPFSYAAQPESEMDAGDSAAVDAAIATRPSAHDQSPYEEVLAALSAGQPEAWPVPGRGPRPPGGCRCGRTRPAQRPLPWPGRPPRTWVSFPHWRPPRP